MRSARLGLIAAGVVWGGLIFAPLGAFTERARAAPAFHSSTRVVLFTPSTSDPLVARIEAELAAVGISVRRMATPSDAQIDAVVTREIGSGASAAIRIIPRSRGTEVWTGDTTARVLSRPAARGPRGEVPDSVLSVIALRTVEFLRASLLDVKRRPVIPSGSGDGGRVSAEASATRDRAATAERNNAAGAAVTTERHPTTAAASTASAPSSAARTPASVSPVSVEVFVARPQEATANAASRADAAPTSHGAPVEAPPPPAHASDERPAERAEPRDGQRARNNDDSAAIAVPSESVRRVPAKPASAMGERRLQIAAGPALLASLGGMGPIAAVAAVGRGPVVGRWGWELIAVFPVIPAHLTNPTGAVDVTASLFGAAATFQLSPPGPWFADGAVGLSGLIVHTTGTGTGTSAMAVNTGYTQSAWQPCAHLRVGAGYHLNSWLTARADALAGVAAARTRISTLVTDGSNNPVVVSSPDFGTFGRAFVGGMLALQASW